MRALLLERPGSLKLSTVSVPSPGPGEVLIRIEAATTCGTDLKAYLRGHPQIPMPGLLGHEYSGVVAESGEGAPFEVGDAVMGVHSAPCQECKWCRRGQENLCESVMSTKVLGSFAEYLLIPARIARLNLFRKPLDISFEEACLLEPLACVAQGLLNYDLNRLAPDLNVLIIGPGAIGLMFVAALKHLSVNRVVLAGRNRKRLEVGERLGAETVSLGELSDATSGFDLVIECTGSVEIWEQSISYAQRGGTVMLFGGCPGGTSVAFDTRRVHYDQITLLSPFHFGTEAVRLAREWLLHSDFKLDVLLSGHRKLEEGPQVFEELQTGDGIKYIFRP